MVNTNFIFGISICSSGNCFRKIAEWSGVGQDGWPVWVTPIADSPLGLVLKKEPFKFCHIRPLSYPAGSSLNGRTDREACSVSYTSFDMAGIGCKSLVRGHCWPRQILNRRIVYLLFKWGVKHQAGWKISCFCAQWDCGCGQCYCTQWSHWQAIFAFFLLQTRWRADRQLLHFEDGKMECRLPV